MKLIGKTENGNVIMEYDYKEFDNIVSALLSKNLQMEDRAKPIKKKSRKQAIEYMAKKYEELFFNHLPILNDMRK